MNKFKEAIVRHEIAKQKVDALTVRIGAALGRCPIERRYASWDNKNRFDDYDEATNRVKSHLWMAYNAKSVYGEHFDEDGQEDSLHPRNDGCRHCLRAFRLIRQRKGARQELGMARRSIRALGRNALKEDV